MSKLMIFAVAPTPTTSSTVPRRQQRRHDGGLGQDDCNADAGETTVTASSRQLARRRDSFLHRRERPAFCRASFSS
jgi:hypothetical protein